MTEGVPRIISTESAQLSKRCCLQPNECQQKRLSCAPVKAGVRGKTPVSCDGQLSYSAGVHCTPAALLCMLVKMPLCSV